MRHATRWILPVSLAITSALATTSTFAVDLPVLQKAATALGTNNLRSIEYSGTGFDYALGQAAEVDKAWPKFNTSNLSSRAKPCVRRNQNTHRT